MKLVVFSVLVASVAVAAGNDSGPPKSGEPNIVEGASLAPGEMSSQASDYMAKIHSIEARATKLQDDARKKKDVIKLNCVGDKLAQIKGHIVVADQTNGALAGAIGRGDQGGRQHEFTRMTIIFQKVVALGTEAEACVGEDASYVGDTKVDVDVDPNIPDTDPTEPQLPLPDVGRPPEATPFV